MPSSSFTVGESLIADLLELWTNCVCNYRPISLSPSVPVCVCLCWCVFDDLSVVTSVGRHGRRYADRRL